MPKPSAKQTPLPRLSRGQKGSLISAFFVSLVIQVWGIATPSLWQDEIATISASHRPANHLWHLLKVIDAVHGTYYFMMHYLGDLIGFSVFAVRLPSAIAIAVTTLLVWFIARRLFGTQVAWLAFAFAVFLPRLSWAATEARSYAFDALLGALLLLLLLKIMAQNPATAPARKRRRLWLAYGLVLVIGTYFFVYFCLLALAHGLWILFKQRRLLLAWLGTFVLSMGASAWILSMAYLQKSQIHWLPKLSISTITNVFVSQYFEDNPTLAFLATGVVLVATVGGARIGLNRVQSDSALFLGLQIWLAPALILAYSAVGSSSIYDARYFTFLAPMVAIALALGVHQIFSARMRWVAAMVVVLLCLPTYFQFRSPYSKNTNWNQLAAVVGQLHKPGDGVLFTDFHRQSPTLSRLPIAFPEDFTGVTDITVKRGYMNSHGLFAERNGIAHTIPAWPQFKRILVVEDASEFAQLSLIQKNLVKLGFKKVETKRVPGSAVIVFSK